MKHRLLILMMMGLLALALPAQLVAADMTYTATLSGNEEVPAVDTDATGDATVTVADGGGELSYAVNYEGLSGAAAAAHIHFGAEGENGPVMIPLEHGDSPFSGTFAEADFAPVDNGPQTWDEALEAIADGDGYVNIHTAANPGGELRGQLAAPPPTDTAPTGPTTGSTTPLLVLAALGLLGGFAMRRRMADETR